MPYNSGATATERSVSYKMPVPTSSRYGSTGVTSSYRSTLSDRPYYSSTTGSYSTGRSTLPRSPLTTEYRLNYSATTSNLSSRTSSLPSHGRQTSLTDDPSSKRSVSSRERSETRDASTTRRYDAPSTTRRSASSVLDADFYNKYSPSSYVPNSESTRPPKTASPVEERTKAAALRSRTGKNAVNEVSYVRPNGAVGGCSTLERRIRQISIDEVKNANNNVDKNDHCNDGNDDNDGNNNVRRLSVAELRRKFVPKGSSPEADGRSGKTTPPTTVRNERAETARQNGHAVGRTLDDGDTRCSPSPSPARKTYVNAPPEISSSEDEDEEEEMAKEEASTSSRSGASLRRSVPISNISASTNITAGTSPKATTKYGTGWMSADDSDTDASSSSRARSKRNEAAAERGLTGLVNIGNTCFMNSVIQCLSNTKPLLEYLIADTYLNDMNNNSGMKGKLISAFSEMVHELWSGSGSVASPVAFKAQISKYAPRFMGYAQQDAQEFLRFLLEGVHEDVNRVKNKPRHLSDAPETNASPDQKAVEQWKRYLRQDDSKIVDLFVGQLRSTLRCSVCGHCSVTFDPFWDLQLPIPTRTGQLRLQQCLDHFTTEEVLDGNEKAYCAQCEKNQKSTKSFTIQKFPKILVLQLNRFSPTDRYRRKLSVTVDFPLDHLDLSNYSAVRGSPDNSYSLYGVSNHSGSPSFGHYMAYCKHPHSGQWHEYNDSRVSSISTRSIVSSEAYLLFYELSGSRGSHL